ncbi:reverse transcriptase [Corchorus capsularis]|uniref:Reverse transcriptase n=1 Tax=Corchorus capsularis TaxID=210143 RepID=A0A1R3JDT0_COCAP|nr:reverse transcriptase [Corchorus capsularis]
MGLEFDGLYLLRKANSLWLGRWQLQEGVVKLPSSSDCFQQVRGGWRGEAQRSEAVFFYRRDDCGSRVRVKPLDRGRRFFSNGRFNEKGNRFSHRLRNNSVEDQLKERKGKGVAQIVSEPSSSKVDKIHDYVCKQPEGIHNQTGDNGVPSTIGEEDNYIQAEKGQDSVQINDEPNDGYASCEEVDLLFDILDEDMQWLEKSAIVLLKSNVNPLEIMDLIKDQDCSVKVSLWSNLMLILIVEEEASLGNCIGMVKNACLDCIIEIAPWDTFNSQWSALVRINLSEVPLELWHVNFFSALGDHLGKFIQIDSQTSNRKCFVTARLQILVSSLSNIPKLVVGKSLGVNFKIPVSVETMPLLRSTVRDGSPVRLPLQILNCDAPSLTADKYVGNKLLMINDVDSDKVLESREAVEFNDESRTKVLDEEIVGESLRFSRNMDVSLFNNKDLAVHNSCLPDVSDESLGRFVEEPNVSDPGPHFCHSSSSPTVDSPSADMRSETGPWREDGHRAMESIGKRLKWKSCRIWDRKKRKKSKRGVTKIILGEEAIIDFDSGISLSDEDIRMRNEIIYREAEKTFDVSSDLGLQFCEEKSQIVSRGLGRREKRKAMKSLVVRCQADFLLLQESKLENVDDRSLNSIWGNNKFESRVAPAVGPAGGLISIWDKDFFDLNLAIVENRYIVCVGKLKLNGVQCLIGNIYAPNDEQGRLILWQEIKDLKEQFDLPWILGGDFNTVLKMDEREGAAPNTLGISSFGDSVNDMQLVDLPLLGAKFTWGSNREIPSFSRLDRFLVNSEVLLCFPDLKQKAKPKSLSDHNPILLSVDDTNWGPKPFKFFSHWLEQKGFQELMSKAWHDFEVEGTVENDLKQILVEKKAELWKLYRLVERSWQQKARMQWLRDGDKNSKFFHLVASNRARRNHIEKIEINGKTFVHPEEVKEGISSFFEKFYNLQSAAKVIEFDCSFKKLSSEKAVWLERVIDEVELWDAIKACDGNKALGPDGFNLSFIKDQWESIKAKLLDFVNNFCSDRGCNSNFNNSFVTLIPKCDGASKIEQYRPISLVGCLYKIIAKVFARRIRSVMSEVIGDSQFAFIKSRQILDCSLIANESVDAMKKKEEGGVCFKVDFEKAYDSVDWNFLEFIMRKMGFGETWIKWIMRCVSTPSISILINGSVGRNFSTSRGLRQGCPLSPFLFNLIEEAFSLLIHKACSLGLFEGVKVGNVMVSHLQYADNTLIMCKAKGEQVKNVRRILRCFQLVSGLKVNFAKSSLIGINANPDVIKQWADEVNCKVGSLPCSYLGLPLGARPNAVAIWKPVIERCQKKLATWKARHLSTAGRLVLIKSVFASCPVYFMSLFNLPCAVKMELEKLMRKFLWSGSDDKRKIHYVDWDTICKYKEFVGLGSIDLGLRNRALLNKWLWRYGNEHESLWHKVIIGKNKLVDDSIIPSGNIRHCSAIWNAISKPLRSGDSLSLFTKSGLMISVGDGKRVKFWEDNWVNGLILKEAFPRIFALAVSKVGKAVDFGCFEGNAWRWKVELRRNLFDWENE